MTRALRALWTTLTACALAGCQSLMFSALKVPTLTQDFQRERLVWSSEPLLEADVYRPSTVSGTHPTVVFWYGGSWRNGTRSWYRFVGATLAEAGFTVIIPDYRKVPDVHFPAFIEDAARAVAYVHAQIERFGGDRRQLFLMGHSAGAHIAALLCTDRRYLAAVGLRPADIAGMVGLAGPYDFLPLVDPLVIDVFNGDPHNPQSQPVNFVDGDEPAMLLLHGDRDRLVWPRNSQELDRRVRAAGGSSTLAVYPQLGHAGILLSLGRGFRHWSPALQDISAWIRERASSPMQELVP